jgi:hypothetical protein
MNTTEESTLDLIGPGPFILGMMSGITVGPTVDGQVAITLDFPSPVPERKSPIQMVVGANKEIALALIVGLEATRQALGWPLPPIPIVPERARRH